MGFVKFGDSFVTDFCCFL